MTDHDEWLAWRRQGIGGSDIPALLNLSSFATPYTVWADKMGFLPATESTQRQRLGHRLEAILADEFHEDEGLWVTGEQTWVESQTDPVLRCTVDGFVVESPPARRRRARGWWRDGAALASWQAKTDGRYGWPDGIPGSIAAQCVYEMGVCGLDHAWLSVIFAGWKIAHYSLEMDRQNRDDFEFMAERALKFWNDHVVTGTPPAADPSEVTRRAITKVNPAHAGERCDLDHVAYLVQQHEIAATAKKNATLAYDEIGNQLRVEMGTAEVAMVDGVDVLTLHQQTRTSTCEHCGHTTESAPFRVLRHVTHPTSRRRPPAT